MEQKSGYVPNKHNQENDMKTDDDIDLIAILSNN